MNFTDNQNQNFVQILQHVKCVLPAVVIGKRKSKYICDHIRDVGHQHGRVWNYDSEALRNFIAQRINYRFSLETWLRAQGIDTSPFGHDDDKNFANMQQYRLRWLDSLIEEFSR